MYWNLCTWQLILWTQRKHWKKNPLSIFFLQSSSAVYSCVQCIHDGKRSYWHSSLLLPCKEAAFGFTAAMDVFCCRFITNGALSRNQCICRNPDQLYKWAKIYPFGTRIMPLLSYSREEFWFIKHFFWICANTRFFLCLRAGSLQEWLINLALCNVRVSPREFRFWNVPLFFVFSKNCLWL